jgi:misacylated tRNA(Ala) deacylase
MSKVGGTIVGALACQRDSYLKTFKTTVLRCTPLEINNNNNDKKKGSKKLTEQPDIEFKPLYEIELQDTVLFPEGGGQPSDRGFITIEEDNDNANKIIVLDVQRKNLRAIHITDKPIDKDVKVNIQLDWRRRLDHMQQHTGQHLLSAILDKYELPTLSWNMGDMVNYIEIPRKLTDDEMIKISQEINDEIFNNTVINVEVDNDNNIDKDTDKEPTINQDKGVMRIVKIGSLDENPCCGTHLSSVGQIKVISLLGQMKGKNGTSKINFITGDRVYQYTAQLYDMSKKLMVTLSSSFEELNNKAEQITLQAKKSQQRERNLNKELASLYAMQILQEIKDEQKNKKFHYLYRQDGDLEFINKVYTDLKDQLVEYDATVILVSGDGAVIIGGASESTVNSIVIEAKKIISQLRGGGKNGRFQGKAASFVSGELDALAQYIKSL